MTTKKMREMLVERASALALAESVQFILDEDNVITVDKRVTCLNMLEGKRVDERSLYSGW